MVKWLKVFLADKKGAVRLDGATSKQRIFRDGLLQGSCLSPLLFLTYIDDLAGELGDDVFCSLFADDLAL